MLVISENWSLKMHFVEISSHAPIVPKNVCFICVSNTFIYVCLYKIFMHVHLYFLEYFQFEYIYIYIYIYIHIYIYYVIYICMYIYIYIYSSLLLHRIGSKTPCGLRRPWFLYKINKSLSKSQFIWIIHLDFLNHNPALLSELTEH